MRIWIVQQPAPPPLDPRLLAVWLDEQKAIAHAAEVGGEVRQGWTDSRDWRRIE